MKNKVCTTLGNNIKRIRKQQGYKQDELAELLDVEVKSLSLIETGNGFISAKTLEKLSDVLKTPIAEFFEEDNKDDADRLFKSITDNLNLIKKNSRKLSVLDFVLKNLL